MNKTRKDHYAFNPESFLGPETKKVGISPDTQSHEHHETVTKAAGGEGEFSRQLNGKGQYGHVIVEIAPNKRGQGIEVISKIVEGIPADFIQPAADGVREGLRNGVVAGYPVVDIVVRIVGGSFHEIDSSALAFKMAGIFAIKAAMKNAEPILLE